jgi:hypothetical protein
MFYILLNVRCYFVADSISAFTIIADNAVSFNKSICPANKKAG